MVNQTDVFILALRHFALKPKRAKASAFWASKPGEETGLPTKVYRSRLRNEQRRFDPALNAEPRSRAGLEVASTVKEKPGPSLHAGALP